MWKILCATTDDQVLSVVEKLGQYTSFFQVKCVSSVDDALWAAVAESFDAYVIDAGFRHDAAINLCRAIRASHQNGKILCLSSNEGHEFKSLDAGADAFLLIPNQLHLLHLKIEDLLDAVQDKKIV